MPYRQGPCGECPARRDNARNPRARFPAAMWRHLRATTFGDGGDLFGCHRGAPGHPGIDCACAGVLAAFGQQSLTVLLARHHGRLPAATLRAGERWPALYTDWDQMAAAQTLRPGDPVDHLPPLLQQIAELEHQGPILTCSTNCWPNAGLNTRPPANRATPATPTTRTEPVAPGPGPRFAAGLGPGARRVDGGGWHRGRRHSG
ncbi:DUF6283 family protein [Actinomadura harenae]|uniref:Uncharacterized protein n=1 Tax=Actinomadura harenae TaxID=2483351 RepID=A0A3M2LB36_9ACTN|nr:DUF6283 family protein [Actinomadura harenae]RMI33773.1 hypothetical protein EBO15_41375 [Actinomadura harenae]